MTHGETASADRLTVAGRWLAEGDEAREVGLLGRARERYRLAADAATHAGDPEALALAAYGLGGVWVHEQRSTIERLQVLELQRQALARLPRAQRLATRLRARIVAEESYASGDVARVLAAVDEARARGEPEVTAELLSLAHHCLLGPQYGLTRLELAEELIALAAAGGSAVDALMGSTWRAVDLFLRGDPHAERGLRELKDLLARRRFACVEFVVAAIEVMQSIRSGRLAEAEELAAACHRLGSEVGDADADGWYGAHLIAIRWYQDRAEEILPMVSDLAHSPTLAKPNDAFFGALAVLAASVGHTDEARAALARLRVDGLAAIRSSSTWMVSMAGAIEAAVALGDADAAREGYDLLAPFADLPVMASLAVTCFGSAHRPLGLAARTFGDADLAVAHLEAAVVADLRLGNRPAHAISCAGLAEALRDRAAPGDDERAATYAHTAVSQARRHGMPRRAAAWQASLSAAALPVAAVSRLESRGGGMRQVTGLPGDPVDHPALTVRLIGGFAVSVGGRIRAPAEVSSRKGRMLLALLAVERGHQVSTDRIVDALWGDRPPRHPARDAATLVSRLRAALGLDVVSGGHAGYRLGDRVGVDLHDAASLLDWAEAQTAAGRPGQALATARRALGILQSGGVLDDEPDAMWVEPARSLHEALTRRARHAAGEAALRVGDPRAAVAAADAAVGADPLDEPAARLLIRAHAQAGEPARALAAYHRLQAALAGELGVDPSAATRDLHLSILQERLPPVEAMR